MRLLGFVLPKSRGRLWSKAALVTLLVPGLLYMQALPDTPQQQQGSTTVLPSLVDASVTRSPVKVSTHEPKMPKNAVPLEARFAESASTSATTSSSAAVLASGYCSTFALYNGSYTYSSGSIVRYGSNSLYRALVSVPTYAPPGSTYWTRSPEGMVEQHDYWTGAGSCTDDPPPTEPDPKAPPTMEDLFPVDQMLVDSLTPLLVAHARSNEGGTTLRYTFKVCDNAQLTGTGCWSSGQLAGNVNTWRVPSAKLAWGKQYWWQVSVLDTSVSLSTTAPVVSFTTGVRQPPITAHLAATGANGQEFHQLPGNYTTSFTDATVASAGPPLSVVRSYNSMDPRRDGMFGAGWSTRLDMKIVAESVAAAPTLLVTSPDGRQVRFADKGDGTYQPPPGMQATLGKTYRQVCTGEVCAQEPTGWRLMDTSLTSYVFDLSGRLTTVTDNLGRSQVFAYGTDGKLASVTGSGGRALRFTWVGQPRGHGVHPAGGRGRVDVVLHLCR